MKLEDLEARLSTGGYSIVNRQRLPNDKGTQLTLESGQKVNVFDTGTWNVQGKNTASVDAFLKSAVNAGGARNRKVFVVYGHDQTCLAQLDAMLRRWKLEPLILPQLPSGGQTLIEKLEHYQQDAAFGVVLATPDDEGYKRGEPGKKLFRARQNVVLEYGMLLASPSLGRHRVALLLKDPDDLEPPSDIKGLIYIPFRESVEDVRTELAKEMKQQGIVVALEDV